MVKLSKVTFSYALVTIILAATVIVFTVTDTRANMYSFHNRLFQTNLGSWNSIVSYQRVTYDASDPRDATFYNIILEKEAIMFKPCTDDKLAASIQHSSLSSTGGQNGTYNIGEEIFVHVSLYDGYGKQITTGGDHLRATIENNQMKASAPCIVTDNNNGTHSVICGAFWSGKSTIIVFLSYTRETICTHYRVRTQVLATRNIYGLFKSGSYSEEMACHPNHTYLLMKTNYTELCNLTYMNSGMPFYCGKPKNEHLLCQDWEKIRTKEPYPKLQLTNCEDILLKRGQQILKQSLNVNVLKRNEDIQRSTIENPSIHCFSSNLTKLWTSRRPTGYFYEGKWKFLNCLGFHQNQYEKCLKNRRLYLFGDSTIRAWYTSLVKRFKCQPTTEKWMKEKWHKMAECYNKELNFKAGWYPHAQPFYVGQAWDVVRYTLYSTSRHIDNIPRNEHAIIVIHLYMHVLSFHHSVFRERMQIIRQSIERLFLRNKYSVVMIKGPHTFTNTPAGSYRLCDYFGFVYSKILYEVFDGLFDRVVLLNNKDTTIARHVQWNHPTEDIVDYMIDQMLSYACEN